MGWVFGGGGSGVSCDGGWKTIRQSLLAGADTPHERDVGIVIGFVINAIKNLCPCSGTPLETQTPKTGTLKVTIQPTWLPSYQCYVVAVPP
jgi:hypothetical protein